MKKHLFFLLAASFAAVFAACSDDKSEDDRPNTAPSCKITYPLDGQTCDATLPLLIKGRVVDTEDNLAAVRLTVGGEVIDKGLELPFFEYEIAPDRLAKGPLTIELYAEDAGGLSAQHRVTIDVFKEVQLMAGGDGNKQLTFGYWTEEREARVLAETKWTIAVPEGVWFETFDETARQWVRKTALSGEGPSTIRLKASANDLFEDRYAELKISTPDQTGTFVVTQNASPDLLTLLEDELFRMAAQISAILYGMDADEDGKISAYEAEIEPKEGTAYGFDAGGWNVTSTKGIENFPHLRHLDVNSNPDLTEIDLSSNHELMSIHVHNCTGLKQLDLTQTPRLIELGCNYDVFLSARPALDAMKAQVHTLGIFNRKADQPSALDFTGYSNLQRLYVNDNGLTELTIAGCTQLWRLVANGNAFTEIDLSEVDRLPENDYLLNDCPNLKRIYVWKGFTTDYYHTFAYDKENGIEFIEK